MNHIYSSLEGGGVVNSMDVAVKIIEMLSVIGDNVNADVQLIIPT